MLNLKNIIFYLVLNVISTYSPWGLSDTQSDRSSISVSENATIGPELVFSSPFTQKAIESRLDIFSSIMRINFLSKHFSTLEGKFQKPDVKSEFLEAVELKNSYVKYCTECKVITEKGKWDLDTFKIIFPNGYWIRISCDPGVVELQTQPLPYTEYLPLAEFIQENVYDVAQRNGLEPVSDTDGHTNLGVKSTFENPKELVNFLLDLVNNSELAMGVLGEDYQNAPPLILQSEKQIFEFYKICQLVYEDKITTFKELAIRINENVYFRTFRSESPSSGRHNQMISLKRLLSEDFPEIDQPVELRFTASRKDFKTVLLNYELFIKRIQYLKKFKKSILPRTTLKYGKISTPSEKLSRFFIYVSEMEEYFDKYRPLIYDQKIAMAQLDFFVDRTQIITQENKNQFIEDSMRYIDEIEVSEWIQNRFRELLTNSLIARDLRLKMVVNLKARLLTDLPKENKIEIEKYLSEFDSSSSSRKIIRSCKNIFI